MTSVGVVLGAGGIVGAAYHAGVLTALAEAGFDARDAAVLVGTSAGSGVAATVRAGFPPLDLAPRSLGRPISAEAARLVGDHRGPLSIDVRPRPPTGLPRPSSLRLLLRSGGRPAKALAGLLPEGTIATDAIGERITVLYRGRRWPDEELWICAVDLDSGALVVFGRDAIEVPVGVAVRASSAIPGFFQPVAHGGRRFIDGGVHSPTNADLLVDAGLDLVVVVSPMSVTSTGAPPPGGRPVFARQLAVEVGRLKRAGTEVLTFQPTPDDSAVMGRNSMDAARCEATTKMALESAQHRLAGPEVADRLAVLRAARSARRSG